MPQKSFEEQMQEYKSFKADRLGKLMKENDLPRSDHWKHLNKLNALLKVTEITDLFALKNLIYQKTSINSYGRLIELTNAFAQLTGKQITPHDISSGYISQDEVLSYDFVDRADINLSRLKHDAVKGLFVSLHYRDACKLILYLDILERFNMRLLEFVCTILDMNKDGQEEASKAFPKTAKFFSFFQDIKFTYDLIVLREKIINNQVEKDIRDYWHDFVERNANLTDIEDESKNEEHAAVLYDALWSDFTRKIDSIYDGTSEDDMEYLFFSLKIEAFLWLFNKENVYIWEWIICYFRLNNTDNLMKRIREIYENHDYRISSQEDK